MELHPPGEPPRSVSCWHDRGCDRGLGCAGSSRYGLPVVAVAISRSLFTIHQPRTLMSALQMLNLAQIYPSLANHNYLADLGEHSCIHWPLGPRIVALLWEDNDATMRSIAPLEVQGLEGGEDAAWSVAMGNLGREIETMKLTLGLATLPGGGKAAFFDQHWLASATLLHNGLIPWISNELGATELMALVPCRESIAYFSSDCGQEVLDAVESFSAKAAAASRKPFGRNLFRVTADGPVFVE